MLGITVRRSQRQTSSLQAEMWVVDHPIFGGEEMCRALHECVMLFPGPTTTFWEVGLLHLSSTMLHQSVCCRWLVLAARQPASKHSHILLEEAASAQHK